MNQLYFYLDWSGTTHEDHTNYYLAAVVVDDPHLEQLERDYRIFLSKLRRFYRLSRHTSFTASDLFRGRGEFKEFHIEDRLDMARQLLNFIVEHELPLFTVYVDKSLVYYNYNRHDFPSWVKQWSWKLMIERISQYAYNHDSIAQVKIQSINKSVNQQSSSLFTSSSQSEYVISSHLGSLSHESKTGTSFLQLADLVAWVIRRYYQESWEEETDFDIFARQMFDQLSHLFAKDAAGQVEGFGVKIFPEIEAGQPSNMPIPVQFYWNLERCLLEVAEHLDEASKMKFFEQIASLSDSTDYYLLLI